MKHGARWVRIAASAIAALLVGPAYAHPEYERPECAVVDSTGREIQFVKSYVDGIFFTDPVKIVVRDRSDLMLDETEFARDALVMCTSAADCTVFRYEGRMPVLPAEVLRLEGSRLIRAESTGLLLLGTLLPLRDHGLGYLLATGLFFVPILSFRRARRAGARNRTLAMIVTGALGLPCLLMWLYGVVALSRLSLPLLLLLIGTSAALFEYLRRRYSRPRQPSLKVGRA